MIPDELRQAQRTRLRRTLFAIGGAAALTAVVIIVFATGGMRLDTPELALLMGGFWAVNLAFLAAILTGLNLRLADPSMTLVQMLWATLATFAILYFVDEGRHLLLMVYLLAMMFGAFRLDVSEYLVVTLFALVLYGLVIGALHRVHPESVQLRRESINWLVFFVVMVGFSLLGSETSRLRSVLQRRNRELREARDAAAIAYQAKSRFLATTSHELRTPLNLILGAADVIGEQGLDAARREALARTRHAGAHLLSLVNSMIDLSKLESGALELRREVVDLRDRLEEVHAMMLPLAERRGVRLVLDLDPGLTRRVEGDAGRLGEVLVHLLNNALKFTDTGEVRLGARRDSGGGTRVRFSVSDTGCGMDARQLAALFRPSDPGEAPDTLTGSSLGLTLCRDIVDLMGGVLEAVSTPGEGSRFSFAIPLPEADVAPATTGGESTGRLRVLVVDDSEDNRMLIQAFLRKDVGEVAEAENGAVGLELFTVNRYDVVLMDMHMPEMDGIEATRAIRAVESRRGDTRRTAILALTADDSVNDRQRSLDAGCDDHLVKPVSKKALLAALATYGARTAPAG